MPPLSIKASGIRNLTDARYFAAWYAEDLGFPCTPGLPDQISEWELAAIREWVDGPRIVGEFQLAAAEDMRRIAQVCNLDAIQVDAFTEVAILEALGTDWPIYKEVVLEPGQRSNQVAATLERFAPYVAGFILQGARTGVGWPQVLAGQPIDLPTLQRWQELYPIWLEIDVDGASVLRLRQSLPQMGLVLRGGEEEKVGYKSYDQLDAVLESLEDAGLR